MPRTAIVREDLPDAVLFGSVGRDFETFAEANRGPNCVSLRERLLWPETSEHFAPFGGGKMAHCVNDFSQVRSHSSFLRSILVPHALEAKSLHATKALIK